MPFVWRRKGPSQGPKLIQATSSSSSLCFFVFWGGVFFHKLGFFFFKFIWIPPPQQTASCLVSVQKHKRVIDPSVLADVIGFGFLTLASVQPQKAAVEQIFGINELQT